MPACKRFLAVVLLATRVFELHFAVTGLLVTTLTGPFLPIFTVMGTTKGSRVTRQIFDVRKMVFVQVYVTLNGDANANQCSGDIRLSFFVVFSVGLSGC